MNDFGAQRLLEVVVAGSRALHRQHRQHLLPAGRHAPVFIRTGLLLTDAECASLAQSARAILIKGGGALEGVLDNIRRWRLPLVAGAGRGSK